MGEEERVGWQLGEVVSRQIDLANCLKFIHVFLNIERLDLVA